MTDLTLRDDLVQRLQQIAQREHRRLDEIVENLLDRYDPVAVSKSSAEDELRQDRIRIYDRARHYWQNMNHARQYLSNEDLDQQFWLIDSEGIPRLKEDQATIALPPDALAQMLEMAEADRTVQWQPQLSNAEDTKNILNAAYTDYLLSRLNRPDKG